MHSATYPSTTKAPSSKANPPPSVPSPSYSLPSSLLIEKIFDNLDSEIPYIDINIESPIKYMIVIPLSLDDIHAFMESSS